MSYKNYYSLLFLMLCISFQTSIAQGTITNDTFWDTEDGEPIYSQGGGIFKFTDPKDGVEKYYWYGSHYKEAELYRQDPSVTQETNHFKAATCYTSTDLVNWKFEGNALERSEVVQTYKNTRWMGRLGVAYLKKIDSYAMFIQHNAGVLITLSEHPAGPFKVHRRLDMTDRIGTPNTGDQTVFTDPDTGTSYLVYSYGQGRNKIYLSEIGIKDDKVDLLNVNEVFRGKGREGNCMVKHNVKYYLFASNLYGWDSSYAYYLVADDINGPYLPENKMLITPGSYEDYAHITQTGFFVNVKGSKQETIVYCGDRWADFAGNGLGYNQWVPLSFDGEMPYFNSLNSWNLNASTGEWHVAKDNNYVRNPSFEADRRKIPSPVKPIKEQLLGWHSKVMQGNVIVIESKDSPELNYFNSREDRKHVIGEKSLNIADDIAFKRKVYQIIESTPYVNLEDGTYTLSAKIKQTSGFSKIDVYADSSEKQTKSCLSNQTNQWRTINLKAIQIKNEKVEIGFIVHGEAGASCQIDDVSLVKN